MKHLRNEVGALELNLAAYLGGYFDRLRRNGKFASKQVGVGKCQPHLLPSDVANMDFEEAQDFIIAAFVDDAQTVELVDARGELSPFDVGEPRV